MKGQTTLLLCLSLPPLLGGCLNDLVAPDNQPIETDTTYYALREDWVGLETDISIRFVNKTRETVYIVNCRGGLNTALEKQVDDGWEPFWAPVLLLCLSPPIVIEPWGELVADLHIWGALPGNNAGPAFKSDDVEGVYRLVLGSMVFDYHDYDLASGWGEPVPLEYRVSNRFFLDDPRM